MATIRSRSSPTPRSRTPPRSCTTTTSPVCRSSMPTGSSSASSPGATSSATSSADAARAEPARVRVRPTIAEVDLDAIAPQRPRCCAASRRPPSLCAVVKADGYGHGALGVRAALEAGATLARRRARRGRRRAARRRHRRARSSCSPSRRSTRWPSCARADLEPTVYTRDGVGGARARCCARRVRRVWPVHLKVDTGMHRVGCAPDEAVDARTGHRTRVRARARRRLDPLRGRRRARQRLHRRAARRVRRRRAPHRAAAGRPSPFTARGELGRRDRPPGGALRPRALRHRHLRHRAVPALDALGAEPGCARRCRCRSRVSLREAGRGGRTASPTGCATRSTRDTVVATVPRLRRRRAPQPRARRWRGADRRPAAPDRRDGDDGPAHGRLRRRRRVPSATRSC